MSSTRLIEKEPGELERFDRVFKGYDVVTDPTLDSYSNRLELWSSY